MTTTKTYTGSADLAEQIAAYHYGETEWLPDGFEQIGAGQHRTVYVDHTTDTVYKVGDTSANQREARVLAELRTAGVEYAPATHLHEVAFVGMFGDLIDATVITMPYLPEDGSVEHAGVVLPGAGDLNPDNVIANGGQLWLIDAGGM